MKIKVALGAKFKGFTYNECFSMLKGIDCDGIELLPITRFLFEPPELVAKLSEKFNVPVISIHAPIYLVPFAPKAIFTNMINLRNYFPQVDTYVVHISSFMNYAQNNTKKIKIFLDLAKDKKMFICFESNPKFSLLKYYPRETYDPDAFGTFCLKNELPITFDTSHISSAGGNIVDFYEKYHKNIRVIHLSDFKDGIEHLPLGHGCLPLDKLFKSIHSIKLFPKIILEINEFPGIPEKNRKIKTVIDSIKFAKELAK